METRKEKLPASETERELTEREFHHHLHHHHPHPHHPLSVPHGPWERRGKTAGEDRKEKWSRDFCSGKRKEEGGEEQAKMMGGDNRRKRIEEKRGGGGRAE